MIDLHLHSNCSDGLDSPKNLIDKAIQINLKAIALTDHDTMDGVEEFLSYGEDKDIITISGIEFSIRHEPKREIEDVHIVGINIDHTSKKLQNVLKQQIKGRREQKQEICKRLSNEFGYDISFQEVKQIAGSNSVGRPHIVEIMIKNNPKKVKAKTKNELFKMISFGGKAYIDRKFELNLEEAIDIIKDARGIPILAHPGIYEVSDRRKFLVMCIEAGIQGIEIEYTYNKNRPYGNTEKAEWAQRYFPDFYRDLADKFNLIKSGGSDYHGGKKNINIGDPGIPDKYLKSII
ncbi:MAG: DNA polymerase III PolC-type [Promethearchaeota archaeon]|nr:MAG: DNA polymerase III PolC-type [Candidatus Lokiarchaeota archaeon]